MDEIIKKTEGLTKCEGGRPMICKREISHLDSVNNKNHRLPLQFARQKKKRKNIYINTIKRTVADANYTQDVVISLNATFISLINRGNYHRYKEAETRGCGTGEERRGRMKKNIHSKKR